MANNLLIESGFTVLLESGSNLQREDGFGALTLTANLGGLTATLTETPKVGLTLTANLGGLTATLAQTPKVTLTLAAPLGGLSATLTATPTVTLALSAPLGSLTATLAETPKVTLALSAPLGSLTATLAATPKVTLTLSAPLGGLTATLAETPTVGLSFTAGLGGATATLAYTVASVGATNLADAAQGTSRTYLLRPPVQIIYGYCATVTVCTTTTDGHLATSVETVSDSSAFETRGRLTGYCRTRTTTEQRVLSPKLTARAFKPCRDPDEELAALAAFLLSN